MEGGGGILAVHLTQPQQGRGQIMPTTLLLATPDFQTFCRPCKYLQVRIDYELQSQHTGNKFLLHFFENKAV